MTAPDLPGVLTAAQIERTAGHIADQQLPSGRIPWFPGHTGDPWDHVEAAMALTACGRHDEARRAYTWSASTQGADGTWPMEILWDGAEDRVVDASADTNQCAYLAVGVWHHWLVTGDDAFARSLWPTVRAAIDFVCDLQQPGGTVSWARDPQGQVHPEALLTGNACLVLSLRCAMALAELVGDARPDWELAAAQVAHAVAVHPEAFADRSRFSMDWYYPVLGGALRGPAARVHLDARWDEFVVAGRGVRCVADRPWVTAAETCELVLALDAVGDRARARQLLRDIQFCRLDGGGYWTGWVFPEEVHWPEETSTWTSAAVVLAADALADRTPAAGLFRGDDLPRLPAIDRCDAACTARVGSGLEP